MNVFEGSRRIALAMGILACGAAAIVVCNDGPYVPVTFSTTGPDRPFLRMKGDCPETAAREYLYRDDNNSNGFGVSLCFLAQPFPQGKVLIPYQASDGSYWGNERFSTEVRTYTSQRAQEFSIPTADLEPLAKEYRKARWKQLLEATKYTALGIGIYWGLVAAIGWIVRGFMGIPRGMDKRP
jgi:hypothetical protein